MNTLEQHAIHKKLAELGVNIVLNRGVTQIEPDHVVSNCTYTDTTQRFGCDAVVMVSSKIENNGGNRFYIVFRQNCGHVVMRALHQFDTIDEAEVFTV